MAFEDRYGLPLSTSSEAAAEAYRGGLDLMLSAWSGAASAMDRAIEADGDFALAYAARARNHLIYAEIEQAREKAATARKLVARNGGQRFENACCGNAPLADLRLDHPAALGGRHIEEGFRVAHGLL